MMMKTMITVLFGPWSDSKLFIFLHLLLALVLVPGLASGSANKANVSAEHTEGVVHIVPRIETRKTGHVKIPFFQYNNNSLIVISRIKTISGVSGKEMRLAINRSN